MSSISTPTDPAAVLDYRLTAADRCDSCGAQAYIAAEVNGSELLYAQPANWHADVFGTGVFSRDFQYAPLLLIDGEGGV